LQDNVYGAVIMAASLREFTCSSDECRTAPSGRLSSAADVPVVR